MVKLQPRSTLSPSPAGIFPSGTYVDQFALISASAPTGTAVVPDQLYGIPFFVTPECATVDRIGVNLSARTTITLARLGIYLAGTDAKPGSLLLDAGEIDCSGTGDKEITINQTLPVGQWVFLAVVTNGTGSMITYASPTASMLGWASVSGTAKRVAHNRVFVYAALPATFAATSTSSSAIAIRMRTV